MGRSNTLPTSRTHRQQNHESSKPLGRSSTTAAVHYLQPTKPVERSATTAGVAQSENTSAHRFISHLPFHHSPTPRASASDVENVPSSSHSFRPELPARQNSVQTRYMTMLLALDTIPRMHNILASFSTWILLAGFILFPGTFTSLSAKLAADPSLSDSQTATQILYSIKNKELLVIGAICCGLGAGGMCWLWYRWKANYVWLLNRIFLPGCLNSLAGLISTLTNVYSQQGGNWSISARVTAIVTGSVMAVTGVLFAIYNFWILAKVKSRHGREWGHQNETGEGLKEKIERVAMAPALEPGSVV